MPNNGTLRLPLSPIGLHDLDGEGSGVDTPPDPVEVSTYTSSGAAYPSSSSISPTNEPSIAPSQPASSSSPAINIDPPTAPTDTTLQPPDPTPIDTIGDEDDDDENLSETHSFWDWLTDKISDAWDKITGSPS
jgi:hypothetical protein